VLNSKDIGENKKRLPLEQENGRWRKCNSLAARDLVCKPKKKKVDWVCSI
jgi:hypothetical protein